MKQFLVLNIIVMFCILKITCCSNLNIFNVFLQGILSYKKVKFIAFFTCFRNRVDTIQLHKSINKELHVSSSFVAKNYSVQDLYKNFHGRTHLGFLLDVSCDTYRSFLYKNESHKIFRSPYKWFILDTTNKFLTNYSTVVQFFSNIPLRVDSDVTAFSDISNTNVVLHDVYKPNSNNEKVKINQIGFWTPKNGMIFTNTLSRYQPRKNLTGTVIRFGVVRTHTNNSPSIDSYYKHVTTGNFDTINKLSYALYIHLLEIHNFSPVVTVTGKWFGGAVGGADEGLARLLYEGSVECGISSGLLKSDRIPFVDFIAPAYPFRTCFMFRNPGISTKVQNEFLRPFETGLWYTVVGFVLLFCVVLIFFGKLSRDYGEKSWISSCLLTWSIMCQQGAPFIPKSTSGRCTLLSLLIMSLLLYNYYTSSIVSSLLSGLPPPFKTIEELSHSDLDVGMEDAVYTRTLFEVTNDERIKYLYKHKVLAHNNQPSYMTVAEGIVRVKSGGFAYHSEPILAYSIVESTFEPYQICELAEIHVFTPTILWVMSQKEGQYNKLFQIGYLKMLESGIIARQRSIWIAKKPACLANAHLVEVGIQPLLPAFLLLIFGLFVSFLLLILEISISKYKARLLIN